MPHLCTLESPARRLLHSDSMSQSNIAILTLKNKLCGKLLFTSSPLTLRLAERSRLRTLRSLRVLDVVYCSVLGRPYSTEAIRTDNTAMSLLHMPSVTARDSTLIASFELC